MKFIIDAITDGIWNFFAKLFSDMIAEAFKLITETIIKISDVNKYLDINKYLLYIQMIAGALLLVKVAWECIRYQTDGAMGGNTKSLSQMIMKVVSAGVGIYVLPWSVLKIMIPANNYLMEFIQSIGFKIEEKHFSNVVQLSNTIQTLGSLMIIVALVLAVGFLVLAIAGGIRYVELLICILFAPIAAVSLANDTQGVEIWFKESICIVFTQSIHIFLLQILISIMTKVEGPMMAVLSIGAIAVMLKGPQVLRNFLYTSGVGNVTVGTAGSVGRMALMAKVTKMSAPTA